MATFLAADSLDGLGMSCHHRSVLMLRVALAVLVFGATFSVRCAYADEPGPAAHLRLPSVAATSQPTTPAEAARTSHAPRTGIRVSLLGEPARLGFGERLIWPESWGRWNAADIATTSTFAASTVALQLIGPRPDRRWRSTSRIDDATRDVFRARGRLRRSHFRDASDVLLSLNVSFPFLFDAFATAWWYRRSPEVGRELALMAIEVQFVTAAIQAGANVLASRVRPYVQECGGDVPADDELCGGRSRFRSFFSGHTSQSFAGAATTCMYHARLPLYGGTAADGAICGLAMTSAALTGLFRIVSDMHHLTDVITGALVGTGVGILVPAWRMRHRRRLPVVVVPSGSGVALVGWLP